MLLQIPAQTWRMELSTRKPKTPKTPSLQEIDLQRQDLAVLFDSQCYICHKTFQKYFVWHHIAYRNGAKKYDDFPSYAKYQAYIIPYIKAHMNDFVLLCAAHHRMVELFKMTHQDRWNRLVDLVDHSRDGVPFA